MLADNGYDVWLGNFRGSIYSTKHLYLNYSTDAAYWNFSFHEHGVYDIPAFVNYIYEIREEKIEYIGYSSATSAAFVYCSIFYAEAYDKLRLVIHLAPIAFLGHYLTWPVREVFRFFPARQVINTTITTPQQLGRQSRF